MDYIFWSTLLTSAVVLVVASYDIACSWSVDLKHRFKKFFSTSTWVGLLALTIYYLVPKLHLETHGVKCRVRYSFNFHWGVGRTHGESVEQTWAPMGAVVTSTREMGPNARRFTLEDQWAGWNHTKLLNLGNIATRYLLS